MFLNYVRPETLAAANAPQVARQTGLPLAQAWGGGMVGAVDPEHEDGKEDSRAERRYA